MIPDAAVDSFAWGTPWEEMADHLLVKMQDQSGIIKAIT